VTVAQLRALIAYNRWANDRLLQTAQSLGREDLERDLGASFGSLRGTLVPDVVPGDYPDLATLLGAWRDHDVVYEAYLAGLTQADLDAPRPATGLRASFDGLPAVLDRSAPIEWS
jgi:hypothetical protein